jgi:GT2 family glycosyltransferase
MLCEIILVNWKRVADTCACLSSIEKTMNIEWHAVICENGSPDNSVVELRNFLVCHYTEILRKDSNLTIYDYFHKTRSSAFPQVTVVVSPTNLGFAGGNNLAYHYRLSNVNAEYVWFLNNDTVVEPYTLSHMIEYMKNDSSIGICGSTLIYAHDRKTVQALGGATYYPLIGHIHEIGKGKTWPCSVDVKKVEKKMRYVSGASMLVRKNFIEQVGLMCEDYFLYYEEIDWAERGRRQGFRLGYARHALVYHKEGSALGSGKSSIRSALSEYYGIRGRLAVTRKFFPFALPTVFLFSLLQIVRRCMQGKWVRARLMTAILFGFQRIPPEEQ